MSTVILNGKEVNYQAAVELMDDEICAELHQELAPCTDQEFMDAYVLAHAEKFDGEEFQVN